MNRNIYKIAAGTSALILELSMAMLPVTAQTMPDKTQLTNQITADATAKTSQINAGTSSSSSQSSSNQSSSAPAATTSIANTGNNTQTTTSSNTSTQTDTANQNTATVNQTVNAVANTGANDASRNIAIGGNAGVITTGNASVNTAQVTQANTNTTGISTAPGGCTSALDAINTGNNTSTANSCSANTTTLVNNGNTTIINQATNALANTGGNTAARNISIGGASGVISTGNASTNTSSLVTANGSVMLVGGASNGHGPGSGASIVLASASNAARYSSLADANSFFLITNDNRATIAQTCGAPLGLNQLMINTAACTANTGNNVSSRNIARGGNAGIINTGDAVLNVSLLADANNNANLVYGSQPGTGSTADILNTGSNTNMSAQSNSNQTIGIANSNQAAVGQTVNAYANTGHNTADRNISFGGNAGVITTGNAAVNVLEGVRVNTNQTAVGVPVAQGSPLDPLASILNSGAGSNFIQTDNRNNTTTVNNSNLLSLSQNTSVNSNTGDNSIIGSIGSTAGLIYTGSAVANVSETASGNSNTTLASDSIDPAYGNLDPNITPAFYPTPIPSPTSIASNPQGSSVPLVLQNTSSNSTTSQPIYNYYYTYGNSSFPASSLITQRTPLLPKLKGQTPLVVRPGDVLAADSTMQPRTTQSQIAWIVLSVLSSLVGIGVYINRHSFLDPSLYR